MENFTPIASTIGGIMIGLAVAGLYFFNGRILGISNITYELLKRGDREHRLWRLVFLAGLLTGGFILLAVRPDSIGSSPTSLGGLALAGLLVGFGASLGRGCTSGHGICGISRLSPRSITATLTFMATGMLAVYITRHVIGGGAG
jgi:uncharacterized membrane protein YedE/YeeE